MKLVINNMKYPTTEQLYTAFVASGSQLSTDSRTLRAGDFFFALSGENFNGNIFAKQALEKGAAYVVIDSEQYYDEARSDQYFLVKNTTETLAELALHHRRQLTIPVIAIGGSNGKSTTKDLVRDVLATEMKVCATAANDNNHIGVAQTLLSVSPDHQCVVLELGSNNPGEMHVLIAMSEPSHGLVTNIGKEHLGNFGGLAGVIKEECELYNFLKKNKGVIFAPDNDSILQNELEGVSHISYGQDATSNYVVTIAPDSGFYVTALYQAGKIPTQLVGNYNLQNIAASIAVGSELGISIENIVRAIASYEPLGQRSQLVETEHNTVIYDCYNSNPSSLSAALETFAQLESNSSEQVKNKVLIIGDMLELGEFAQEEHRQAVELMKKYNFENVYLVGPLFCEASAKQNSCYPCFAGIDDIIAELQARPIRNSFVFIKASKGILWKYHRFDEFGL